MKNHNWIVEFVGILGLKPVRRRENSGCEVNQDDDQQNPVDEHSQKAVEHEDEVTADGAFVAF